MRRKLVAGNWKMNGSKAFINDFQKEFSATVGEFSQVDVALFPPSLLICDAAKHFASSGVVIGAQNVSQFENGAYTGEISAAMLLDVACDAVLVGHSERRALFGEDDCVVLSKVRAAIDVGLAVILCVGETLLERESALVEEVISRQIKFVLNALTLDELSKVTIAYEPVWAIGTGETATPEQAQQVHAFIRGLVAEKDQALSSKMRILYGGSVKPDNAEEIFSKPDVDGGLIGGASLLVADFVSIVRSAIKAS
ncbi:MAG: triose-phosphate isomerase [Hahellaceae bacterium]|nr:triose-phosphate isomerase [Hahellaceae bacterium]